MSGLKTSIERPGPVHLSSLASRWTYLARRQARSAGGPATQRICYSHTRLATKWRDINHNHRKGGIAERSLLLPRSISHKRERIACVEYTEDHSGGYPHQNLTKSEIAHQFGLQGRDLRDIDIVSDLAPRILVRPSSILVALFDIHLLIQAERVLVVEAPTCTESSTTSAFMYSLEQLPLERKYELPFELRVLEAALIAVTSAIETDFLAIKESVDKELPDLNIDDNRVHTKLLDFLEHSRRLGTLKKNAGMVHRVINDLLNEDEDLAAMYLTDSKAGQPHSVADHQEVEYLLETYLERTHSIVPSADVMMKNIAKTEETINVVLDAKRNQIMVFEVRLAILTVAVTTGTFIAGLFGMNLINYFEDSPWGFGIMTGACVVAISGCSLVLARLFRQIRRFRIVRI